MQCQYASSVCYTSEGTVYCKLSTQSNDNKPNMRPKLVDLVQGSEVTP